jgi:hypothetical protein
MSTEVIAQESELSGIVVPPAAAEQPHAMVKLPQAIVTEPMGPSENGMETAYFVDVDNMETVGTVVTDNEGKSRWVSHQMPAAIWIVYYKASNYGKNSSQIIAIVASEEEAIRIEKDAYDRETEEGWDHIPMRRRKMVDPSTNRVAYVKERMKKEIEPPVMLD